jgi:hypothetical protein
MVEQFIGKNEPVNLLCGAYTARSIIADLQRCVNLYPEKNQESSSAPITHYPTPGLTELSAGPSSAAYRCLYETTQGELYGVVGSKLYHISESWVFTELATLATRVTKVSMADNGFYLVVVDGTDTAISVKLDDYTVGTINGPNFYPTDCVKYLDGFLIFNRLGTNQFFISLFASLDFDPLYIASKTGSPDPIVTIEVVHREIWLIGTKTTEIWYNSGAAAFPFERVGGSFIEHGSIAARSNATLSINVFWLSRDKNGTALVAHGQGYEAKRASTHAIEVELGRYTRLDDAIGMSYQILGHNFYVLTFPTVDKTWVYDQSDDLWHELVWLDSNGDEHRHRMNAVAFAYGKHVVGDRQNGKLYKLDKDSATDDGQPVMRKRVMPHVVNAGQSVIYDKLMANMEGGTILDESTNLITLRYSDTRGRSWSDGLTQTMGKTGEHDTNIQWNRLGSARDKVFELSWSGALFTALNGVWLHVDQGEN